MAQPKVKSGPKDVPIPDKIQSLRAAVTQLTGNANFPDLQALLPAFTLAINLLETNYLKAQGSREAARQDTTIQNESESALDVLTTTLVEDVNREAGGDKSKLQTSGFALVKDAAAAGIPGVVTDFSLSRGDNPGEIDGHCHAVEFARQYESQIFVGPLPSGPFVTGKTFLKSKFEWSGFASGDKVWIQIRATGTNGEGPWSNPIALIAP